KPADQRFGANQITCLKQRFQFASEPANIDVWIAQISSGLFLDCQNSAKSSHSFLAAGFTGTNSLDFTFLKRAAAAPGTFLLDVSKAANVRRRRAHILDGCAFP